MDDEERKFWCRAALRAEHALLVSRLNRDRKTVSPVGIAHLAAEYADAMLEEFRRRVRTGAKDSSC